MSVLFLNNATTTLSAGVGDSATSITVADGSVFPSLSGSDYFYLTLEVDSDPDLKEIVKCTARSGNTLTITRAQDHTSARTFSTADKCELRLTAAGLNDVATQADTDTTYSVQDGELSQNNFTDADHTKLDGIEASATADQTAAEIKTAYESNSDTNAFTDADHSKLDGIEASATADQTASEIKTAYESNSDTNAFTDADHSKLDGIEASATADQTAAEIRTLVESASNSNVFTDADHSKLNGIEASATADQTAAEIRTLVESASDSNVFTDADHTKLNNAGTQSVVTTAPTSASGFANGHVWYVVS